MSVCDVPDCPALAVGGGKCALHRRATTAKAAGVTDSTCPLCRRKFQKADFVMRAGEEAVGKKGELSVSRWRHVACEPTRERPSKQQIAESVKPLWGE